MPEPPTMTIGEVARQARVRTSAIRYYETVGVLPEPERRGGQRRYTAETVRKLAIIDTAQHAGFNLEEIGELLHAADEGHPAHEQLRKLAERKLPEVQALVERSQAMQRWLTTASGCNCSTLAACGLFNDDAFAPAVPAVQLAITRVGR